MNTIGRWLSRVHAEDCGQSLVEVALTLPILLLILIGIVDIGRVYSYKVAVMNAAREAAFYGARDPQSAADGSNGICQRARDELGAGTAADPCATAPITVVCQRGGTSCGTSPAVPALFQTAAAGGADVTVTVTYSVTLISTYLVARAFSVNPVSLSSSATFVGLGQ